MTAPTSIVAVTCPLDGEPLEVALVFVGDPPAFGLYTSPGFAEHMNREHGGLMTVPDVWPPEVPS